MPARPLSEPAARGAARLVIAGNLVLIVVMHVRLGLSIVAQSTVPPSFAARALFLGATFAVFALGASLSMWGLERLRLCDSRTRVRAALPLFMTVLVVVVFADLWSVRHLGVHALGPRVLQAVTNPGASRELRLPDGVGLTLAVGAAALALVQFGGVMLMERVAARWPLVPRWLSRGVLTLGAAGLVTSAASASVLEAGSDDRLVDAAPIVSLLLAGAAPSLDEARPVLPAVPTAAPTWRPTIVFLLVESLRADMLSAEYMPHLTALASSPGCVRSARHLSGAHTTEYGVFSMLYGLDSVAFDPIHRASPRPRSVPLTWLRHNGYRLVGASASALRTWNDSGFLTDGFDVYDELTTSGTSDDDEAVVRALAPGRGGPTFYFGFFNATHHNYQYPPSFERHLPVIEATYDHFLRDEALAKDKDRIRNRYLNAVLYVDDAIARVVGQFAPERARGELIVVITGDHGEEFWEHGLLGHAAPRFVGVRTEVPFVACGLGLTEAPALSSHVDVWPTIMDAMGLDPSGLFSGRSLLEAEPEPIAFVGGLDFPWGHSTAAVVTPTGRFWLARCRNGVFPCVRQVASMALDDVNEVPRASPALLDRIARRLGAFVRVNGL